MRDIVVLDTANVPYYNNRIFDPAVASKYPGALSFCRFKELATQEGFAVMTGDLAVQNAVNGERMVVITEQASLFTNMLEQRGAVLAAVFCLETPPFAWRYYRDLGAISRRYRHTFGFPGAATRVSPNGTVFHPTLFPQPFTKVLPEAKRPWGARTFMAVINSNLTRRILRPSHLLAVVLDKDLGRELYSERRKAIRHFHSREGFHVYGRHWTKWKLGVSYGDYKAARGCYKGICGDKIDALAKYKFSICFENTVFPGYITEKIFDCFYAGCVPVYYGAPDIEQYIPGDCYIDFRRFRSYQKLDDFISMLTEGDYIRYRTAARDFLESKHFEQFTNEHFASSLVLAVKDCSQK